jgi:hypothetical protein
MPRMKKYVRETIRRKCHHCGKMATNPLVHHTVPGLMVIGEAPPTYSRNAVKTNRVDLRGDMKIITKNYCNRECKRLAT